MFAMTRLRLLGALVISSALAALVALVVFSSDAQANHSWGNYHWARTSNDLFNLPLGDNVTLAWDSYLGPTADAWSVSSVLDTTVVRGKTKRSNCRPSSGRVEVCNYKYGSNGWLGLAQIWISGSHIVQGTTKVNDTYFNRTKYNTSAWRKMVMCQEVGHTFGLDHQNEDHSDPNLGTCMDYTNDPSGISGTNGTLSNELPNQGDYDELLCVYDRAYKGVTLSTNTHSCTGTGHLDSTTTVGSASAANAMPPAANQGNFNSRAEWGRKIHESPKGQLELYERDFGGGKKIFTFVIRA